MAGFPQSGIQLVVQGINKFVSDVGKAGKGVSDYQIKLDRLNNRILANKTTQTKFTNEIQSLGKKIQSAANSIGVYDNRIKNINTKLSILGFTYKKASDKITEYATRVSNSTNKANELSKAELLEYNRLVKLISQYDALSMSIDRASNAKEDFANMRTTAESRKTETTTSGGILNNQLANLQGSAGFLDGIMPGLATKLGWVGAAIGLVVVAGKAAINSLKSLANELMNLGKIAINIAKKGIDLVVGAFKGLLSVVSKIISPITTFIGRIITIASGMALYNWIRGVTYGFGQMKDEMIDSLSVFQQLEVRFNTLMSFDISRQFGIPFADAMEQAADKTAELFEWVKKLAVTTPFTVQTIADVLALSVAMGMTVETSKSLTIATGNLVSALGLTDEHMWRIIYNLGQMLERGRLTGEEFRDLTRNLFPVYDVLERIGKRMGKTGQEMKAMALEGGVPVMDFINEFITMSDEKFGGAMERLSRTFKTLTQNIKDFFQAVIGLDVFGPIFNKIVGDVADRMNQLLANEQFRQGAKALGQTLTRAFDYLVPILKELIDSFKVLLTVLGLLKPPVASATSSLMTMGTAADRVSQALMKMFGIGLDRQMRGYFGDEKDVATLDKLNDAVAGVASTLEGEYSTALTEAEQKQLAFVTYSQMMTEKLTPFVTAVFTGVVVIGKFIRAIANFITGVAQKFGESMSGSTKAAATWGQKLVEAFAVGMEAGLKLIIKVIMMINAILRAWLAPGSDPQVAIGITGWGTSTVDQYYKGMAKADPTPAFNEITRQVTSGMEGVTTAVTNAVSNTAKKKGKALTRAGVESILKYMEGWTKFDFTVFNDIADKIESYLRTIGDSSDKNLVPMILKVREAIAKAVNDIRKGFITIGQAAEQIGGMVAGASKAFQEYIRLLFEAAAAEKAVAAAEKEITKWQKELNKVTSSYEKILDDLNKQLEKVTDIFDDQKRISEIDEALTEERLTAEERLNLENEKRALLIQQQIRDTETQQKTEEDAIQSRIDLLEAERDAAKERLDLVKEQLDAAEALIDVQIKQNELLQEFIDLLKSLKEALSGKAGAEALGGSGIGDVGGVGDGLTGLLNFDWEQIIKDAEKNAADWIAKITGPIDGLTAPGSSLDTLITQLKETSRLLSGGDIGGGFAEKLKPIGEAIKNFFLGGETIPIQGGGKTEGGGFDRILKFFYDLATNFDKVLLAVTPLTDMLKGIFDTISGFVNDVTEDNTDFENFVNLIEILAFALSVKLLPTYAKLNAWTLTFKFLLDQFKRFQDISGKINEIFDKISDAFTVVQAPTGVPVQGGEGTKKGFLQGLYDGINTAITELPNLIVLLFEAIWLALSTPIQGLIYWIWGFVEPFLAPFNYISNELVEDSIIPDMMNEMYNIITGKLTEISTWIGIKITEIETSFDLFRIWVQDVFLLPFQTKWEEIWGAITDFISNPDTGIIAKVNYLKDTVLTGLKELVEGDLSKALNTFRSTVLTWLKEKFDGLLKVIEPLVGWFWELVAAINELDIVKLFKLLIKGPSTGNQSGGTAQPGRPTLVGEVQPEIFVPSTYGRIIPSVNQFYHQVGAGMYQQQMASAPMTYSTQNVDNSVTINVDANYAQTQSKARIYHDVSAALVASRL